MLGESSVQCVDDLLHALDLVSNQFLEPDKNPVVMARTIVTLAFG